MSGRNNSIKGKFKNGLAGVFMAATVGVTGMPALAAPPPQISQSALDRIESQSDAISSFMETLATTETKDKQELRPLLIKLSNALYQINEEPALITDRMFAAWKALTAHENSAIRGYAIEAGATFVQHRPEYVAEIMDMAQIWAGQENSTARNELWRLSYFVQRHYKEHLPQMAEIVKVMAANSSADMKEGAAQIARDIGKIEGFGDDMLATVMPLLTHKEQDVRERALGAVSEIISNAPVQTIAPDVVKELYKVAATDIGKTPNRYQLHLLNALVAQTPSLAEQVFNDAHEVLTIKIEENSSDWGASGALYDTKAYALNIIATIDQTNPSLVGQAVQTMIGALSDDNIGLGNQGYALVHLGQIGAAHQDHAQTAYDQIKPYLDEKSPVYYGKTKSERRSLQESAMLAMGYLGEAHVEYARTAFDAAVREINNGGGFSKGFAISIVGALGAAHSELRQEAFDVLADLIENKPNLNPDYFGLLYRGLGNLSAEDSTLEERAIQLALADQPDINRREYSPFLLSVIALNDCDRLHELRQSIQDNFIGAANIDRYTKRSAISNLQNLDNYTNADVQTCKDEKAGREGKSRIQTFFLMH